MHGFIQETGWRLAGRNRYGSQTRGTHARSGVWEIAFPYADFTIRASHRACYDIYPQTLIKSLYSRKSDNERTSNIQALLIILDMKFIKIQQKEVLCLFFAHVHLFHEIR